MNNNKIVSTTKTTSALFLAIVLVTGTISLYSSSFMTTASAQSDLYYDTDEYIKYAMDMINDYEDSSSYENDGAYDSEYQSYGHDNYKSKDKDRDSSVSISKINCNSVNYNVLGNVNGDNNIGNDGRAANTNGDSSANVYGGNNGERYNDGYQKGKDITCIINNNNTIITGGGNATDGDGNVTDTCEECFRAFLTDTQIAGYLANLNIPTLEEWCTTISGPMTTISEFVFRQSLASLGVSVATIDALIACLENVGVEFS